MEYHAFVSKFIRKYFIRKLRKKFSFEFYHLSNFNARHFKSNVSDTLHFTNVNLIEMAFFTVPFAILPIYRSQASYERYLLTLIT